ncbi:MAG: hypothetical protein DWQ37_07805 [Planctomycetota bacterium]|nr:MAG: hypothetical protein DWQ37_07805 [Planctomycetota bacterium]
MHRIPFTRAAATLTVVLLAANSSGQTPEVDNELVSPPEAADNGQSQEGQSQEPEVHLNLIDKKLALSMAVDAWGQIEMGEFGLSSVGSEAVRQLLNDRMEVQRALAVRLEKLTHGDAKEAVERALREIAQDRTASNSSPRFRLLDLRRNSTAMLVRVRLEIVQEYGDLLRVELSGKAPQEFDRAYLRTHLVDQMQLMAALKVFEGQASADFAKVIRRARAEVQDHVERAKTLLINLEDAPLVGVAAAKPEVTKTAAER